jgi:hypothetical protein
MSIVMKRKQKNTQIAQQKKKERDKEAKKRARCQYKKLKCGAELYNDGKVNIIMNTFRTRLDKAAAHSKFDELTFTERNAEMLSA